MLYSTLYRAASVTEFQLRLTVVAVDDVAVSPVGAGAVVVDDDEALCACGRGSMGGVLVELASVTLGGSSDGDCAETVNPDGGGLASSTKTIHARTKQVAAIVNAMVVRNGKGCLRWWM